MVSTSQTLDDVFADISTCLSRGAIDRTSDWRWAMLSTNARLSGNAPSARLLVLRRYNPETHVCQFYTDVRTQKVAELEANRACSLLFFDKAHRIQLRASGLARLERAIDGTLPHALEQIWQSLPEHSKTDYRAAGVPGSILEDNQESHYPAMGSVHFCRISVTINHLDWLSLSKEGHRRVQFTRNSDGFNGTYVVP